MKEKAHLFWALGLWVLLGGRITLKHYIHQTVLHIIYLLLTLEITDLVAEQPCPLCLREIYLQRSLSLKVQYTQYTVGDDHRGEA